MKKILVVDDAKLNRELLQDMLNNDYIVETAADGAEALKNSAHIRTKYRLSFWICACLY